MEEKVEHYIIDEDKVRADVIISKLANCTRASITKLIDDNFVFINGKNIKKSDKLKMNDKATVHFQKEPLPDLTPKNIPFGIILDKKDYAIIDKPAGLTVHPAPGHYDDTLVNALLFAFNIVDEDNDFRPGIVHRLDKDTSGLLVIAKNAETRAKLSKLFADRSVSKKYLAIMQGVPKFQRKEVNAPIARDEKNRKRMSINDKGRNSVSIFNVLEIFKNHFLAEVEILTGRTHQIRVHAKHIGHPLVGDTLYGGKVLHNFERQALHSYKMGFEFDGELIEKTAEIPSDMQALIGKLRLTI